MLQVGRSLQRQPSSSLKSRQRVPPEIGLRFLQSEAQEIETQEENVEDALHQEDETPIDVPPQKEKENLDEDMA